jgi:hypothetical protein
MISWVRRFALGVGVLCLLVAGGFAMRLVVAKPRVPFVVLTALDRAATAHPRQAAAPTLLDVLDAYEAELAVACDAAHAALDRALAGVGAIPPERRAAALFVTITQLELARGDLAHAPTAEERAEHDATCERLRAVRRRLA